MLFLRSLAVGACLITAAASAHAATVSYRLTATPTSFAGFTGFTIDYTDTDMDGLLELSEVTNFSGTSFDERLPGEAFTILNAIPDIRGFAESGRSAPWFFWSFERASGGVSADSYFSYNYEVNPVEIAPVPLPAAGGLLLLGLGGLVAMRRRA